VHGHPIGGGSIRIRGTTTRPTREGGSTGAMTHVRFYCVLASEIARERVHGRVFLVYSWFAIDREREREREREGGGEKERKKPGRA